MEGWAEAVTVEEDWAAGSEAVDWAEAARAEAATVEEEPAAGLAAVG